MRGVPQLPKKFPAYCETPGYTTCPWSKPDELSPSPPIPFLKLNDIINFPFSPGPQKWFFPSHYPTKLLKYFSPPHTRHITRPSHPHNTWTGVTIMKALTMQSSPTSRSSTPPLRPGIFSMLFSNTLSLCSSLNVKDQFQIHRQQEAKLTSSRFYSLRFSASNRKAKDSRPNGGKHSPKFDDLLLISSSMQLRFVTVVLSVD